MNSLHQSQSTATADPQRQAAYRRLALTILALDVPTLAERMQASRLTPGGQPAQPEMPWAA